ncbi:Probable transmembrane protein. O-Ag polymerase / Lipid A core - O-antigen ligase / O-Ag chain-length regulator family protein [Flavobacterium psychrophilum]|nr:Probable transmembrane protein. O-Ag polymerase / Lipid A core - O-antigen ligase / O-Ag chain-length regulator family protein [Flavobacterium psychrophilum]
MVYLALILPLITLLFLRKLFSRTYLNPTGILCGVWILIVSLESFFAPHFYFSYDVVFYVLIFVLFFFLGELLHSVSSKIGSKKQLFLDLNETYMDRLKKHTIYISVFSFIGAVFYLKAFVDHFGSFQAFFTAGALIRTDLFDGEIAMPFYAVVPMLFSYSAINLAMVYYVKYGFSWFQVIPFLSVLIMSFSQAARAGLVIVIFQILTGIIFRLLLKNDKNVEFKLIKPILLIIPTLFVVFTLVESFRYQNFSTSSDRIESTNDSFNVYTFGGVAGFSNYIDNIYPLDKPLTLGRYTFSSLYNVLGIDKAETGIYDQYLKVSPNNTANIYSIFRPLIEDFGFLGFLIWAFVLGVVSNFCFEKSLKGSLVTLSMSISIYIYLMFSFIAPLTQFNSFILSCVLCPGILIYLSKSKGKYHKAARIKIV